MIQIVGTQLSQWDVGRSVNITDSAATHIHFANQGDSKAVIIAIENGSAKIPDYLLQTGKTVIAYAVKDGVTLESKSFSVRKRERPENYIYEDDQRNYIYVLITNAETAVANANTATENANVATGRANTAATNADVATNSANLATTKANTATDNANLAAKSANEAVTKANNAVKNMMVVGEAKGETIALNDAIDQTLVGLRVFGKTTQDGTPTPDAPVDLVSAGNDGTLAVNVCGKNLLKFAVEGKTYTDSGITVTFDKDGCVANGTPTKNYVRVCTIANFALPKGTYYVSGGSAGKFYAQVNITKNGKISYYINKAFTIDGTETRVEVALQTSTVEETGTIANYRVYPMLVIGSIAPTEYESYKGQTLTLSTPNGLLGFPVTNGGNYTDANGQKWICDEIDLARGVYVHRVHRKIISNFVPETTANGTRYNAFNLDPAPHIGFVECLCSSLPFSYTVGTDSPFAINGIRISPQYAGGTVVARWNDTVLNNLDVMYILATPIETPLSAEELAAYASLHTYKDNTTVSNDAGAWMDLEYVMDAKKFIESLVGSSGTILPARIE